MRRATRHHGLAVLSLLLLAGVVLLWVRSRHACDAAVLFLPGEGRAQVGASHRGRLLVVFTRVPFGPDRAASMVSLSSPVGHAEEELAGLADPPNVDHGRWGFRFSRGDGVIARPDAHGRYLLVSAPHWLFVVLLSITPIFWIAGLVRHWRWKRTGRCLHCGYDLRASEGSVCPECGVERDVSGVRYRPATAPASG